jgi:hypothetical protein
LEGFLLKEWKKANSMRVEQSRRALVGSGTGVGCGEARV